MARSKKPRDEPMDPTLSRRTVTKTGHLGENGSEEHVRHLTRWAQRSVLGHGRRIDR